MTASERRIAEDCFDVVEQAVRLVIRRYGFPERLRDEMTSGAQYSFVLAVRRPQAKGEHQRRYLFSAAIAGAIDGVRRELGRREATRQFMRPVRLGALDEDDRDQLLGNYAEPDVGSWDDLQGLLDRCPDERYREMALRLAAGEGTSEVAERFGVTPSRICQMRERLGDLLAMSDADYERAVARRSPKNRSQKQRRRIVARRAPLTIDIPLSPREQDIYDLVMSGQTSAEIAATLDITYQTVRSHRKRICGKMGGPIGAHLTRRLAEECQENLGLLTYREREVFDLAVDGKASREIAAELHMAYETVKSHRKRISQKLGPVIAAPGPRGKTRAQTCSPHPPALPS